MKPRLRSLRLPAVLALAFAPHGAAANPDVWVQAASTWRFEAGSLVALSFEWRFDEYFSSRSIASYDSDADRRLDTSEIERLRAEAFDPLSRFGHYLHVWAGGERHGGHTIEDFSASIDGDRLAYRFTAALHPPLDPARAPLVVSLHDPRNVVDFEFVAERFLLVDGAPAAGCRFRLARGSGPQSGHAQPVTLTCGDRS